MSCVTNIKAGGVKIEPRGFYGFAGFSANDENLFVADGLNVQARILL
jgi:hypothetical protein